MQTRVLRADYQKPKFSINQLELHFNVLTDSVQVTGQVDVQSEVASLSFDCEVENIIQVEADPQATDFSWEHAPGILHLHGMKGSRTVKITLQLDPWSNTSLSGLYASNNKLVTQCEAQGFRKIFPFPDQPDILTTYKVSITGDEERFPVMLSNGNLITTESLSDGRVCKTYHDPFPKPSYLFAMVLGDFHCVSDVFFTQDQRQIDLRIYSESPDAESCQRAMDALKKAMHWDEVAYGRIYDLELYNIVATKDFNMGAMENKGLNIFNDKYILADKFATDHDLEAIDAVVGHEYFHNWSGNRVTCENWFYLSLKEGLTVFREQEFIESITHSACNRLEQVSLMRNRQFKEDAGPMAHAVIPDSYEKIDNFYTLTIYEKGSEIIRMLKTILGKDGFRAGMDLYFAQNDGKAVGIDQFIDAMATASGQDLTHFKAWYFQAGTPTVNFSYEFDEQAQVLEITAAQSTCQTPDQKEKVPLMIPIAISAYDQETGDQLPALDQLLVLDKDSGRWKFSLNAKQPILSVLRGFSAPVQLELNEPGDYDLQRVMLDDDPFVVWDSARRIWLAELRRQLSQNQGMGADLSGLLDQVYSGRHAPDLASMLLAFPSWAEIFSLQEVQGHYEKVSTTLNHLIALVGKKLQREIVNFDQKNISATSNASDDVAIRRLQCKGLFYLASDRGMGQEYVLERYQKTENMTIRLAALATLSHYEGSALEDFFGKFAHNNDLVALKWLGVHARSWRENTLSQVVELTNHQAFRIANPNCVYALIGGFAFDNPLHFHAPDLSGYHFLYQFLEQIDDINPQVASYLGKSLHVPYLPDTQKEQIRNIFAPLAKKGCSQNLREVLSVL